MPPPSVESPEWQSEAFSWVQRLVAGAGGGGAAARPGEPPAPSLGEEEGPFEQWQRSFGGLPRLPTHTDPGQQQQKHGGARPSLARRMLTSAGTAELVAAATTGVWAGAPAAPGVTMHSNATRTDSWPSNGNSGSSSTAGPSHGAVRSAAKRELARRWGDMLAYDRSPHGRLYDEADRWLVTRGDGGGDGAPSKAAAAEERAPPPPAAADPATVRAAALLETVARVFEGGQHRGGRGSEGSAEGGSGAPSPELGYGAWKRERDAAVASAASAPRPASHSDLTPLAADGGSSSTPDLSSLLLDLTEVTRARPARFSTAWHSLVRQQPDSKASQAASSPATRPQGGHIRRHSVLAAAQGGPAVTGATNHRVRFLRRKEVSG